MIYVHVPFCRSFCTYCDFYSEVVCKGRDSEALDRYLHDICAEASERREEISGTSQVSTLYFGGGTPSVLPPDALARIVESVGGGTWDEFTVEVNPEDIVEKGTDYAATLRSLGVNRISMGVQCLDDGVLRWMNRRHSASGAEEAFSLLRAAGFDNISVDVIFGLSPDAALYGEETLLSTLGGILRWKPEHVSAYQLSIEEGSALASKVMAGAYREASDEVCRSQYELICKVLREAGFSHYEISNWAIPGREALHNSAYWTRMPYVGLGPGAHSLSVGPDGERRTWNSCSLSGWTRSGEVLSEEEIHEERVMLGLRTAQGIPAEWVTSKDGLVEHRPGRLRIAEAAWFIADSIICQQVTRMSCQM